MKVVIVGAGAMGSLFAGYLARGREEVWAYDVWKEHVETLNKEGLTMTREGVEQRIRFRATDDPRDPGIVDLILVFVKFPQTREALRDARPMVGPQTSVLTLQNGIGNVEILQELIPSEQILFGLTTLTSELLGPGHIEESFRGRGETHFWPLSGETGAREERICSVFNRAGIHTEISPDVELRIWKKVTVNACYNTLSAITRLKVGDLIDQSAAWEILNGVVSEIIQVAQEKGIALDEKESRKFLKQVGKEARDHVPSMLVDVSSQRRTEIDCLNGAIVREGERLGIATPYNRLLYDLIRIIERTYDRRMG